MHRCGLNLGFVTNIGNDRAGLGPECGDFMCRLLGEIAATIEDRDCRTLAREC
jgi:hypothetical protein